ncbi:hypothetical protein FHR87_003628 [Azomonas macrocytogenes]|uniref:Uncharacterized protein n=1 Tax=Azomonas macrocytogenes TaxID=69962 RepID=A0A839TC70_AZOMA|nr:hypothetical protein [Azomonas macrocytogenes]
MGVDEYIHLPGDLVEAEFGGRIRSETEVCLMWSSGP